MTVILIAAALPVAALDVRRSYDEGLRLYKDGRWREAFDLFWEVRGVSSNYREVNAYLARCAEALKEQEKNARIDASVLQARKLLEARSRAVKSLKAETGASVQEGETGTEIFYPAGALFSGDRTELSPTSARFLAALKDYLTTFHTPHLVVSWPRSSEETHEAAGLGAQRAVALGFRLLKDCGLAPERLFIRSRTDPEGRARLLVSTVRPAPEDLDGEFQPVMIHALRRELVPGVPPAVDLDVILLDSARVKEWTLAILSPEGGVVRHFNGGQDLYAQASWDGLDDAGSPVPPGFYLAFLTAETWASRKRTDTIALAVRAPAPEKIFVPKPRPSAVKTTPPQSKPPQGRDVAKWFHTVSFERGGDEIPGPMFLAVEQVARALSLYPGRRAAVEGFAAPDEPDAARLAERRAQRVADVLLGKHGVARDRIQVKGNAPRKPLEGESMSKVLVFFLE